MLFQAFTYFPMYYIGNYVTWEIARFRVATAVTALLREFRFSDAHPRHFEIGKSRGTTYFKMREKYFGVLEPPLTLNRQHFKHIHVLVSNCRVGCRFGANISDKSSKSVCMPVNSGFPGKNPSQRRHNLYSKVY